MNDILKVSGKKNFYFHSITFQTMSSHYVCANVGQNHSFDSFHLQLETGGEQDLDALDQTQTDYLSAASDLEDTDGEVFTDGEAYTDNEELDEAYPGQNAAASSRVSGTALARSSEPAFVHRSAPDDSYREVPPLMHVPEPRPLRRESDSPPRSAAEEEGEDLDEEEPSHRSFTDSDFSTADAPSPNAASDGPPDFVAPDPSGRQYASNYAEAQVESPQHASLSTIEEKLQQVKANKHTLGIFV